jgi:AcrR family transcriptional regulator
MTSSEPVDRATAVAAGSSRRDLAVARVLDPARARAEGKVQAFIDAARDLTNRTAGQDFTVQEVVERSGQSLRSFYQYFDGKYDLLLALFEDSLRTAAAHLREEAEAERTPIDRLHRFVVEYHHSCELGTPDKAFIPGVAGFAHQLLSEHPAEAAHAFEPLTTLAHELLDAAALAGSLRAGLNHERVVGTILQAIMFNAFAATISGQPVREPDHDLGEEFWELLAGGIESS